MAQVALALVPFELLDGDETVLVLLADHAMDCLAIHPGNSGTGFGLQVVSHSGGSGITGVAEEAG